MSKFVHIDMPASHAGADRLENTMVLLSKLSGRFDPTRSMAAMLFAAVVSAILLAANTLIAEIAEGHLLMAWIAMWTVGFAALVLLAKPILEFARSLRVSYAAWNERRHAAAQDAKYWQAASSDARVMAEIRAAMARATD